MFKKKDLDPLFVPLYNAFEGKLLGTNWLKQCVCETIYKMPIAIQSFITQNCWFMGSIDDAWAFTFTGNDLKNQHLIFLSDDLLLQEKDQITFTIAHEIGHVILKHRNSTLVKQSKNEINRQEKEADDFAKEFVSL
jgi:Zn-dependent peptidase ImmA (M78 family)